MSTERGMSLVQFMSVAYFYSRHLPQWTRPLFCTPLGVRLWVALSDEHLRDTRPRRPRDGHDEFAELEGQQLNLPSERRYQPHPKFLQEHRELHEFSHQF